VFFVLFFLTIKLYQIFTQGAVFFCPLYFLPTFILH